MPPDTAQSGRTFPYDFNCRKVLTKTSPKRDKIPVCPMAKGVSTLWLWNYRLGHLSPSDATHLKHLENLLIEPGDIEYIENDTFAQFKSLHNLSLVRNRLRHLEKRWFIQVQGHLNLAHNEISSIGNEGVQLSGARCLMLTALHLQWNNLGMIMPGYLKHLCKLRMLDLRYNKITTIQKGLGGFQLGIVGSDDDGEPERIVEANNKKERGQRIALQDSSVNAKCIGFSLRSNNHSTGVLVHDSNSADDIQRNPVRFQDMKHFVAINRIESLAEIDKHKYCLLVKVSQLFYNASERENVRSSFDQPGLRMLSLAGNNLTVVRADWFPALRKQRLLGMLDLADNQIMFIEPAALRELPLLGSLVLSNNRITSLHLDQLRIKDWTLDIWGSISVKLQGNPLRCTCALRWFLKSRGLLGTRSDLALQTCHHPQHLRGTGLSNLAMPVIAAFQCPAPKVTISTLNDGRTFHCEICWEERPTKVMWVLPNNTKLEVTNIPFGMESTTMSGQVNSTSSFYMNPEGYYCCGSNSLSANASNCNFVVEIHGRDVVPNCTLVQKASTLWLRNYRLGRLSSTDISHLKHLQNLYIEPGNLMLLDNRTFEGFEYKMFNISLSQNNLPYLGKMWLVDVRGFLNLAHNDIAYIEDQAFCTGDSCLDTLGLLLSWNKLDKIQPGYFKQLCFLMILDLRFNRIHTIDKGSFDRQYRLRVLRLSDNNLTAVRRHWFPAAEERRLLGTLDLAKNRIRYIEPGAFIQLDLLETLDLSDNQITSILEDDFQLSDFGVSLWEVSRLVCPTPKITITEKDEGRTFQCEIYWEERPPDINWTFPDKGTILITNVSFEMKTRVSLGDAHTSTTFSLNIHGFGCGEPQTSVDVANHSAQSGVQALLAILAGRQERNTRNQGNVDPFFHHTYETVEDQPHLYETIPDRQKDDDDVTPYGHAAMAGAYGLGSAKTTTTSYGKKKESV
ncbi:hypothetical protein Bbelb_231990 [Branchiostoma belcheri]|nr:hypothetical protein Bbelb_231990 [Branchiostoma belcheri]